jgi:hypothetical protein
VTPAQAAHPPLTTGVTPAYAPAPGCGRGTTAAAPAPDGRPRTAQEPSITSQSLWPSGIA